MLTSCKSDCVQALAKDKELAERKLYSLGSPSERKIWNSLDCPGMIFFVRTILCVFRLSDFWAIPPSLAVIFLVLALLAVLHLARVLLRATKHTPHDTTHRLTNLHSLGAGGDVPDKRIQVIVKTVTGLLEELPVVAVAVCAVLLLSLLVSNVARG